MAVHGPAADRHRVRKTALHQVLLLEQVISQQAAAAALAGHHPHPVHRPMLAVGELAAVLDVVPHAHHDGQQLEANALVVGDDFVIAAPLDPPVAVLPARDRPVLQLLLGDFARPRRRRERHRVVIQARGEQNAGAQRAILRLLRRQRFAELGARFAARAHFGAGLQAETRIARAVAEHAGANAVEMLALVAARGHFGDACRPSRVAEKTVVSSSSVMFGSLTTLS